MEQFNAVLNQIIIFSIIIVIGYAVVKSKLLPSSVLPAITTLFSRVIVPFILFVNTVNGATRADMKNYIFLSGIYVCVYAVQIIAARTMPKVLRLKGNKASLFSLSFTFGNVGFIGIPLLLSVFGQRVMIFVTMYAIVDQALFWTYGYSLSYPVENKLKFSPKTLVNMINPPIIAVFISIVLILLDVKIPAILDKTFTSMSNSGMALPFIYIGGMLATLDLKNIFKHFEFYVGIAVKMVILPICLFIILKAIGLEQEIAVASAFLFGLPTITLVPMIAGANGSDVEYSTSVVLVTTLASLFTLTFVSYITAMLNI